MEALQAPLLWFSVLSPLLASVYTLFERSGRRAAIVSTASLLLSAALLAIAYASALTSQSIVYDPWYADVPGVGQLNLFLDSYAFIISFSSALVSALVSAYSYWYMPHRFEELGRTSWGLYYTLLLLFAAGLIGVGLAGNAILFYIFLELTLIPSFLLIALYGYGDRVRIALMYLVWTQVGSALFLVGVLLAGLNAGAYGFNILLVPSGIRVGVWNHEPSYILAAAIPLVIIGMGIKMALAGLHMWLPYAHAEAPTPLSALLSPNLIGVGAYGILRYAAQAAPSEFTSYSWLLVAWALLTMIYGGLVALSQDDVKRFLAYSSISQMGYLLLGLAGTSVGYTGAMLHYLAHAFGKAALFMVAGEFIVTLHTRSISRMGGLARVYPVTAAAALLGFLHLMGIPPTVGIWSKYFILRGFAELLSTSLSIAAIAALIAGTTITAVYSLIAFRRIFLGESHETHGAEHSGMAWLCMAASLAGVASFMLVPYLIAITP